MCSGKTGIRLITAAAKIAFPGLAKGQKIKEGDAATRVLPGNLWVAVVMGVHQGCYSSNGEKELTLICSCAGFIPGQSRPLTPHVGCECQPCVSLCRNVIWLTNSSGRCLSGKLIS